MTARYRERRRAAIAAGTWRPKTGGAAARAHLATLRATGASLAEIGAAAGLSASTVGLAEASTGKLRSSTAAALLALQPQSLNPARAEAGGTRLRLQALAAMGHSPTRVALATGQNPEYLRKVAAGAVPAVPREVRHGVELAFRQWWDKTPQASTEDDRRQVARTRARAERGGWLPGADLDPEHLDVPGYQPPAPSARASRARGTGMAERELEAG